MALFLILLLSFLSLCFSYHFTFHDNERWWRDHENDVLSVALQKPGHVFAAILDGGDRVITGQTETEVFKPMSESDSSDAYVVYLPARRPRTQEEMLEEVLTDNVDTTTDASSDSLALGDLYTVSAINDVVKVWSMCYHKHETFMVNPANFVPVSGVASS